MPQNVSNQLPICVAQHQQRSDLHCIRRLRCSIEYTLDMYSYFSLFFIQVQWPKPNHAFCLHHSFVGFLKCKLFDAAGNRTCDHVTGEYVCRAGYIGLTCEHPCPVGTYGLNCLEKCTCKNGADCHHVTGQFGVSGCSCTVHVIVMLSYHGFVY